MAVAADFHCNFLISEHACPLPAVALRVCRTIHLQLYYTTSDSVCQEGFGLRLKKRPQERTAKGTPPLLDKLNFDSYFRYSYKRYSFFENPPA